MSRRIKFLNLLVGLFVIGSISAQEVHKLKVVATASMISDMVYQIAGDHVDLTCIVPIGGDPHIYEATPKDAQIIAGAEVLFKNGLTFEGWLNELIENAGSKARVVTVTDGLKPIESLVYQNATDPHAWMDASHGLIYIKNIKDALIAADPKNASIYTEKYETYRNDLIETDEYIMQKIATIPEQNRILITSHDAFQYYGRRYNIRLESVLGTSTDADIQTSDIIRLNRVIRESGVQALFIESTINPKILEQLAKDNKIRVGGKLYADSIGDKDSPAHSYVAMLRHNTDVITTALTAEKVDPNDIASDSEHSGTSGVVYLIIGLISIAILILLIFKFSK